jgi:DNA-binding CsgD family transcriptional regulator
MMHQSDTPSLTQLERECLMYCACGFDDNRVGAKMGLGGRSVSIIIGSAMQKLQASSRTRAVIMALKNGQLKLEDID